MKKLTLLTIILSCLFNRNLSAQTLYIEPGVNLQIEDPNSINGAASLTPTLFVQGDIQNNGVIQNNGKLQLTGNLTNNGIYSSSGDDIFTGNNIQTISGNFTGINSLYNLVLDKSATNLTLSDSINIEEGIFLTNGVLVSNGNTIHLKNTTGNAVHSNALSGAGNNFILGSLKHDITTGQTYTFYTGDLAHGNQKAMLFFSNTGGASELTISYSSDSVGTTNIPGCGGVYSMQSGIWSLTSNGNNGIYDYNITLEPGGANLAAISGIYDGSLKDGIFITDPCANTTGNYSANNLNSFSNFKIAAGNNVALPVTITSFTGRKLNATDLLNWTTGSEQNNAYFNLQHSTDALQFTTIANVNSQAINGNSNLPLNYFFEYKMPVKGHNYYRLEQVDIDGKKSIHAKIIDLIRNEQTTTVNIYPNPATDILNVEFNSDGINNTTVKITDMSGRLVKQVVAKSNAGNNKIEINLAELANAVYSVQVYANDLLILVEKISKND